MHAKITGLQEEESKKTENSDEEREAVLGKWNHLARTPPGVAYNRIGSLEKRRKVATAVTAATALKLRPQPVND